jgi:hypothetical protein
LVIIIGFLSLQAFITLLLTIIIVFIDTAIGYNHIFHQLLFYAFFLGLVGQIALNFLDPWHC